MNNDTKVVAIVAFVIMIIIGICELSSYKTSVEAIKAGLHQDNNGHWIK